MGLANLGLFILRTGLRKDISIASNNLKSICLIPPNRSKSTPTSSPSLYLCGLGVGVQWIPSLLGKGSNPSAGTKNFSVEALRGPKLCGGSEIAGLLGPERQETKRVKRVSRGDKAGQVETSRDARQGAKKRCHFYRPWRTECSYSY